MAGLVSTYICERHAIFQLGYTQTTVYFFPHHELHSMGKALRKSEAKPSKETRDRKHKDGEFSEMSSITCWSLAAEVPRGNKHANLKRT